MRTEDIKNLMITGWMVTISVAIVLSVVLQNITIIKVVSVVLGLGFSIIPFKDGLEFVLLKRNKEEMFMNIERENSVFQSRDERSFFTCIR